jgi:hypothetical protein
MNDSYYWTILRYHNGVGIAKMHGNTITLANPPDLGSGPVHLVRYIPEIDVQEVSMHNEDRPRRMTDDEEKAADALLRRLTREIRQSFEPRYDEPWKGGGC